MKNGAADQYQLQQQNQPHQALPFETPRKTVQPSALSNMHTG